MVPDILADRTLETAILFLRLDQSNTLGMVAVTTIFVIVSVFNIHSEKGGRLSPSMYNFFVLLFEICMLGLLMAYDLFPLETLENKKKVVAQAAAEHWLMLFEHDPDVPLAYIEMKDDRPIIRRLGGTL